MPQLWYNALSRFLNAFQVLADGQITTCQFPQRLQPIFSVVDRAQQAGAQQFASFRASTLSLLLPSYNKALRRGLQTTISLTWGLSTSYSHAAQVPSSSVTCSSPRKPCRNSSRVAALVSTIDSITSLPALFRTAMAIDSWWTSSPIYFFILLLMLGSLLGGKVILQLDHFPQG